MSTGLSTSKRKEATYIESCLVVSM
jgi:hypothetical protein